MEENMSVLVGLLLTPVFMILMASSIGTLWFIMAIAWSTKNWKELKKPDFTSGPTTNKGFKWLWWVGKAGLWKVNSSKWFRKFEPRKSDFPQFTPKWFINFVEKENHGVLEKILAMILFVCLGVVSGVLSGMSVSLQFCSSILGDISSSEEDVHTAQDQLFLRTGRFSN
jgi:hypothetical protein